MELHKRKHPGICLPYRFSLEIFQHSDSQLGPFFHHAHAAYPAYIPILNPHTNLNPIYPHNHPKHLMGSKSLAAPFMEGWPWGNRPSAVPQSNRFTSKSGRVRMPSPTLEVLGRSNWYTSLLRTVANVGWPRASWNSTSFVLGHPADSVRSKGCYFRNFQCFYGVELFPLETTFFDCIGQVKTMLYSVYPSQLHFNLKIHISYI